MPVLPSRPAPCGFARAHLGHAREAVQASMLPRRIGIPVIRCAAKPERIDRLHQGPIQSSTDLQAPVGQPTRR
jgi:hypothetical protein